MDIQFSHRPVLLDECMEALAIRPDGIYVDGTAGGGGHSSAIAARLQHGRLLALDRDAEAVAAASARLAPYGERVSVIRTCFSQLGDVCRDLGITRIDGLLLDLGVSSHQLDTPERGFSYLREAPLDMRMDRSAELSAYDVVNGYSQEELKRIFYEYGEEKFSGRIASALVRERERNPITTTKELAEIVRDAIPAQNRAEEHQHPAKRVFQAIRIAVNRELDEIAPALESAAQLLTPGGRIAVITFHSLEDRIVKQTFSRLALGCTCPRDLPICVCGRKPILKVVTKKPILPAEEELAVNSRSHSAKLRVAEKLPVDMRL